MATALLLMTIQKKTGQEQKVEKSRRLYSDRKVRLAIHMMQVRYNDVFQASKHGTEQGGLSACCIRLTWKREERPEACYMLHTACVHCTCEMHMPQSLSEQSISCYNVSALPSMCNIIWLCRVRSTEDRTNRMTLNFV